MAAAALGGARCWRGCFCRLAAGAGDGLCPKVGSRCGGCCLEAPPASPPFASAAAAALSALGDVSSDDGSMRMSEGYIQGAWLAGREGGSEASSEAAPERTSDSSPPPAAPSSSRLWSSSEVMEGLRFRLEISSAEEWMREE